MLYMMIQLSFNTIKLLYSLILRDVPIAAYI